MAEDPTGDDETAAAAAGQARPAAFLDRDGVLIVDTGYVHRADQAIWVPGAAAAVTRLNRAGYFVFVVTNQSGVARGYYEEDDVRRLHGWMGERLAGEGARIDGFYYCPHHPTEGIGVYRTVCDCRKPLPGLLHQAMAAWPVDPAGSFLVGDRDTDIAAAEAAGLPGYRFAGGDLDRFVAACLAAQASRDDVGRS